MVPPGLFEVIRVSDLQAGGHAKDIFEKVLARTRAWPLAGAEDDNRSAAGNTGGQVSQSRYVPATHGFSKSGCVWRGQAMPAALVTGINSDLPGQVIGQVTEPVYDTVTGRHLLIPQGSKLVGRYDSVIAYGQSRALIVWSRIILPDGSSIRIENLPATDTAGYSGLADRVDNHTLRMFSAAALSSLISVGAELSNDDDRIARALRDAVQDGASRAGDEVLRRQLSVQPTITIRPGWRLRILVQQDLVLRPYGDPS